MPRFSRSTTIRDRQDGATMSRPGSPARSAAPGLAILCQRVMKDAGSRGPAMPDGNAASKSAIRSNPCEGGPAWPIDRSEGSSVRKRPSTVALSPALTAYDAGQAEFHPESHRGIGQYSELRWGTMPSGPCQGARLTTRWGAPGPWDANQRFEMTMSA